MNKQSPNEKISRQNDRLVMIWMCVQGYSLKSGPETRNPGPWGLGPRYMGDRHSGTWNWDLGTWDVRPWDMGT